MHHFRPTPVRKLVKPDSPSPSPADWDIDFSGFLLQSTDAARPTIEAELTSARKEIATLLEAIHQKDQNVISAHQKIEEYGENTINKRRLLAVISNFVVTVQTVFGDTIAVKLDN